MPQTQHPSSLLHYKFAMFTPTLFSPRISGNGSCYFPATAVLIPYTHNRGISTKYILLRERKESKLCQQSQTIF